MLLKEQDYSSDPSPPPHSPVALDLILGATHLDGLQVHGDRLLVIPVLELLVALLFPVLLRVGGDVGLLTCLRVDIIATAAAGTREGRQDISFQGRSYLYPLSASESSSELELPEVSVHVRTGGSSWCLFELIF